MGLFRRAFARRSKEPAVRDPDDEEEEKEEIQTEKKPSSQREEAAPVDEVPWKLLSTEWSPDELLLPEIEEMYWDGVRREVEIILLTLKQWQEQEGGPITLPDESDLDFIHGFDTFVDQVCEESRNFARRYAREKSLRTNTGNPGYYRNQMRERLLNLTAGRLSSTIKEDIRATLEQGSRTLSPLERCAEMLLQSASFLDIEKTIEHDPATEKRPQEKPAIPQLTMKNLDVNMRPFFAPLECSSCRNPIRSSIFWKRSVDPVALQQRPSTATDLQNQPVQKVCEDCYRKDHYGDKSYYKRQKECILPLVISPENSRRMCQCKSVHPIDKNGKARSLFPMTREDKPLHDYDTNPSGAQCRLLKLSSFLTQAKFETTAAAISQRKIAKRPTWLPEFEKHVEEAQNKPLDIKSRKKLTNPMSSGSSGWKVSSPTSPTLASSTGSTKRMSVATSSTTTSIDEAEADEEIPLFFKAHARKYPFGQVRMALRVGPLLIGNGMVKGRSGAVVTLRDPPFLQKQQKSQGRREVLVNGDPDRGVWARDLPGGPPRAYRAVMKQVIGMPFTSLTDPHLELEIIRDLAAASQTLLTGLGGLTQAKRQQILDDLVQQLTMKVKALIGTRAEVYLEHLAARLLDPEMNLSWSSSKNNCQHFCDSLIDGELFAPFVAPRQISMVERGTAPLYLMSFVCRPGSRPQHKIDTKYDVPMGFTEEYLYKYHYGGPSADIIDTLQEYWHDWGAFGRNLYKFQDLFPWDCTEAYGRYPSICGECDLAKHILAFPFDSWSIISLHLTRSPFLYPRTNPASTETFSNSDWIRNRLLVLSAQEILIRVASAMAQNPSFAAATEWLHKQSDPQQDRLKLGGIHRAQPYSHDFEPRNFATFLIAPWTLLRFSDQKAMYEVLRNYRMNLPDVELSHILDDLTPLDSINASSDGSLYLYGPGRSTVGTVKTKVTAPYGYPPRPHQAPAESFATGFGWNYVRASAGFLPESEAGTGTGIGGGTATGSYSTGSTNVFASYGTGSGGYGGSGGGEYGAGSGGGGGGDGGGGGGGGGDGGGGGGDGGGGGC